jgi:UDP-N-acetylmuramate--alanine ligase
MNNLLNFPFSLVKKIHFIGIGGIGMSGIAALFKELGFDVRGSDAKSTTITKTLQKIGVKVFEGHDITNIKDADMVVISSAIKTDNVEYMEALKLGLPIFKRGKMLAELMRFKWGIAVAGTHGKTTTTSIISHLLQESDYDPTAVIGGIVNSWSNNSIMGKSNWLVAESDESDGSFLDLPAVISVVTNIEEEHMEYYKEYAILENSFTKFINNIPFYGFSVLCVDSPGVVNILPKVKNSRILTYGFSPQADYKIMNLSYVDDGIIFDIHCNCNANTEIITGIHLPMYGNHNVLNAVAGIVVATNIGISVEQSKKALKSFQGIKRRFTQIGLHNDIKFIDDYAHHPSEIEAVISSANQIVKKGKTITIVQPHKYSRLKEQFDGFCKCFNNTDIVVVLDVYTAGELPIDDYNSQKLVNGIIEHGHKQVSYVKDMNDLYPELKKLTTDNDIAMIIFMGAGDITYVAPKILTMFQENQ